MFWKKRRSDDDFNEEIASHIAHEADQLRDAGRVNDPYAQARRVFGNVTALREKRYERAHWVWWDHLKLDVRQALRQMRKKPGFSAVLILTLALGIGANSAIFSAVEAVLLRPLPYKDPGRLTMIFAGDPARELHEGRTSLLNFADWKKQSHSFEDMTLFTGQTFMLGTEGSPERMRSARVPANFWAILGVRPVLGRVFTAEEEKQGERVVVLTYSLWQQQFGGSKNALGANLAMDGRNYRVIGVMPEEFRFPFADTKVWEPITAHPYWGARDQREPRTSFVWLVVGRVKGEVSRAAAQQEMSTIERRLQAAYPMSQMPGGVSVVPLSEQSTASYRLSLWLLFGAVFVMLLIACSNAAGLLLAQGSAREREFAVRRALGAKQSRLVVQRMTEALVMAACGGLLGLVLARGLMGAIKRFAPTDIPRLAEARMDWAVIWFTVGITVFSALFASLWPAFARGSARAGSREWTTVSAQRVRDLLVAGEFALTLILISTAGLLIHSLLKVRAVELGFRPDQLLMMRIDLHVGRSVEQQALYFEDAIRRAESIPGVKSAAAISGFLRTDPEDSVEIEGRRLQHPGPCEDLIAGPYFETAGIPLLRGRVFSSQDRRGSLPVAIVNQTMARVYWPGDDAIGKRFRFDASKPWLTVVGVTGDVRRQGIERPIAPQVYLPHRQGVENMMDVIVRTAGDPAAMAGTVRSEIQALDKTVAKFRVSTVEAELGEQTNGRRFDTLLIGGFAFGALLLSAIGVYGLLHHLVVQRTNEIGVRMALGARPASVMGLVLREGLTLALGGTMVGLLGAILISRLVAKLLFEITPFDPVAFGGSVMVLLVIAGVACWVPALRAARIDPMLVLRQE